MEDTTQTTGRGLEKGTFVHQRRIYTTESGAPTSYELSGEALGVSFGRQKGYRRIVLQRKPQTTTHGVDRLSISFDRGFLDEERWKGLEGRTSAFFLHLFRGRALIEFQRQVFSQTGVILSEVATSIQNLFELGLLRIPLSRHRSDIGITRRLNYTNRESIDSAEATTILLANARVVEVELFFDSNAADPTQIALLKGLDLKEVVGIDGAEPTYYSKDYQKSKPQGFPRHSIFKAYHRGPKNERGGRRTIELERSNPWRMEITLSNEAIGGTFNLRLLDHRGIDLPLVLGRTIRARLAARVPGIARLTECIGLHPSLRSILERKPDRRLRLSKSEASERFGSVKIWGRALNSRNMGPSK